MLRSQTYGGKSSSSTTSSLKSQSRRRYETQKVGGEVDYVRQMRIRRNKKKRNALNLKFLFTPKHRGPTIRQAKEEKEQRYRMRAPPEEPYSHMKYAKLKKECAILSIKLKDLNDDEPEESKRERLLKALREGGLSVAIHREDKKRTEKLIMTSKINLEGTGIGMYTMGYTPMIMAALHDNVELLERLVKDGANVNGSTMWGFTPLMCASRKGHVKSVTTLLRLGASVHIKEKSGFTALAHASKNGRQEIVLQLLEYKAEKSTKIGNGETPLLLACRWGRVRAAQLLLNAGASPDVRNKRGQGVFHLACLNEHVQVVSLLRSKNCDASSQDCRGYTPLMIASETGNVEVLDHLLRCKTGYKSRDVMSEKGYTALHLAARMGRK